uniref:Predicted protein n=1 Tax=Hordeum vulgare subsp. vulgare TaxID=112509 RepID=F2D4V9_HORVV|nr:predicted protein [Hordeum vulgare subsp. vulgare]
MFLTDKYHALLPIHSASATRASRKAALPAVTSRFDAALAARLGGLLPLPASPLAALARLADLLAATLADAVSALAAGPGDGKKDALAVAAHLDAGVALLDACNAIAARVDRLRRRRLLSRLALHLVSSSPPSPSSLSRARAALADRDGRALPALPSIPFVDPPRGARGHQLTAAARVVLAVNAVSSLAATAAATILAATSTINSTFPQVSGDVPWAESFNAVSTQLSVLAKSATSNEIDAADEAVGKLAAVLETAGENTTPDEAALRAATQEVEKRTEELAARLERVSDAVNGVFRAALRLRNAELGSFIAAGLAGNGKAPRSGK